MLQFGGQQKNLIYGKIDLGGVIVFCKLFLTFNVCTFFFLRCIWTINNVNVGYFTPVYLSFCS